MTFRSYAILPLCLLAAALPSGAATRSKRPTTAAKTSAKRPAPKTKPPLGQRAIEDSRAAQLQAALIQSGYLDGPASGHWDDKTEAAMQKLQADNGWQTKLVPDSRAIIKLGLGPSTAYNAPAAQNAPPPPASDGLTGSSTLQ